jgi:HlyD family secretion protein
MLIGIVALALLGGVGYGYRWMNAAVEVETARVRPPASTAEAGGEGPILSATGYIIAAHKIEVASKVNGRVAWIGVEKGDRVQQGQMLVRLEDDEYRARLLEAEGQVATFKARLAQLENGSRPEEVARSDADLAQVRADLRNAEVSLTRTRELVAQGILARQALDDAEARSEAQKARAAAFEKSLELTRQGPRREEIEAMRAQVKQAEGTLAFARTQVENTVIRAPIAGTILERNVEKGEFVTTGFVGDRGAKGYVVSLADLNDLQVELDVSQNDFARLAARQPAVVTTDAYPDRKYQGAIAEISPEANRQKATVQVKVGISGPDAYLRPEMNASVAFQAVTKAAQSGDQALAPLISIPAFAVREGVVFIVVDGRAARRSVLTAGTTPQGVSVANGLIGGEDLILNPPTDLKEGQKVRIKQGGK